MADDAAVVEYQEYQEAPVDTTQPNAEFPDAAPPPQVRSLEELKDEAGAWTLASDESVSVRTLQ